VACERAIKHAVGQAKVVKPQRPPAASNIIRQSSNAGAQTNQALKLQCNGTKQSRAITWNGGWRLQGGTCAICLNNFRRVAGYTCRRRVDESACATFVCWDCLHNSHGAALQPDAIKGTTDASGNLKCCNVKCAAPITVSALLSGVNAVPVRVIQAHQALIVQRSVTLAVADALKVQKLQFDAETERHEQCRDQDERNAHKLHRTLVGEVLTLKCPRCKNAFVDFDACFAVTCVYPTCTCGFCAWCLTDCGSDAHTHVAACAENVNNRSAWGTEDMFREHHRVRRARKCGEVIDAAQLTVQARRILKQLLTKNLDDLGIAVEDVFPVQV
jgi:uncharacterized protein YjiS (DUF1127 family)